jgi:hypothetical protein
VAVVQREVIELIDDLLARFPGEEFRVLEHRGVDFLEAEERRCGAKVLEEPVSHPKVLGIEVAGASRSLEGFSAHGPSITPGLARRLHLGVENSVDL